jgi:phospholipid/cholesterol/gamma-HCH transport system substrate-binding protein
VTIAIVVVGLATVAVFAGLRMSLAPRFQLKTCFQNVQGLRAGAMVRLAGVDIGRVREVRAQPADRSCLAAVTMEIDTPYEMKIPRDSVTLTQTEGVLGPTYVAIDSSQASTAPIENGGMLPSRITQQMDLADWLRGVDKGLKDIDERLKNIDKSRANAAQHPRSGQPSPSPTVPKHN